MTDGAQPGLSSAWTCRLGVLAFQSHPGKYTADWSASEYVVVKQRVGPLTWISEFIDIRCCPTPLGESEKGGRERGQDRTS